MKIPRDESEQARQLLLFYAPEIVRLAVAWLDANPGLDAVGLICAPGVERPGGFVGNTHEEVARGVAERESVVHHLRDRAPGMIAQLEPPTKGRPTRLSILVLTEGTTQGAGFPLPPRGG